MASVVQEGKRLTVYEALTILSERELSFVEWIYLFTLCSSGLCLKHFGCPTFFPRDSFASGSSNLAERKGEDGKRKISSILWKGCCGGSNYVRTFKTIFCLGEFLTGSEDEAGQDKKFI